ncbi:MAG: imidazole glycerol phosphate synthase subunit HisF [Patescibacteria group bacterium]
MLKIRIIPTLLWKDVGLVKGKQFDSWRRVGSVIPAVRVYNTRQVDELILVDIMASKEKRIPDFDAIREISSECFFPFTVGGGITDIEHIKQLLRCGADKVSINTGAFIAPDLINKGAKQFGAQCIVVSIDARPINGIYHCFSHAGTVDTGKEVIVWAQEAERRGAGEILLTSINHDGEMKGYDLELIKRVSAAVSIPVIASGGAGNYEDMYQAITTGGASAVAAASIFHFTEQTPLEAKEYLSKKGVPTRKRFIQEVGPT